MSRRNIAKIVCLAALFSLVLGAGCKKKKAAGGDQGGMTAPQGMKVPPTADMDPVEPQGTMTRARPAAVPGKGRVGALPIPHDFMIITAHLKVLRGTALFKKHEPKMKAMLDSAMAKHQAIAAIAGKCKVDVLKGVDRVTIGHSTENQDREATVIIASGGFDTAKLMACMKTEMKKTKMAFKDVTVGGKQGLEIMIEANPYTVLALGPKSLVMLGKPVVALAQSVLEGKLQSIVDTALYKEVAKLAQGKPATILSLLIPNPEPLTAKVQFPIAKKIRTVVAMIGVPGDGLEVNAGADFGDDKTAKSLARTLPALLGFAKAKLGALGAKLLQNLKISADGTWVRLALTADKETFEKLQDMAIKTLGKLFGRDAGSDQDEGAVKDPAPAKPTMKPAPKKKGMK
jgi:hypothetical protein